MLELLNQLIPNVMEKPGELWESLGETVYMVGLAGSISLVLGLGLGVALTITARGGLLENRAVYALLDKTINLLRCVPFVILLFALIPLTRLVVGSSIGPTGAILPLVVGTVPFFSRQMESALAGLDRGLVEAAQSMGNGPGEIMLRVYLRESLPAIIRGAQITFINLVGLTAMAGAVGGGGLGDFAIRYGQQRSQFDVTYVTIFLILTLVTLIQALGNLAIQKSTH